MPATPTRYRAFDHAFALDVPEPWSDAVAQVLSPLVDDTASAPVTGTYTLEETAEGWRTRWDDVVLVEGAMLPVAVGHVTWHVNQTSIAGQRRRRTTLHAAAVTSRGVAVLMPAAMESGKTTTAAGLLRAGYGYLTDEAASIDPDGLVVTPFPKSLSLDPGSWPLFPGLDHVDLGPGATQRHVVPTAFRDDVLAGPTPVGLVVLPSYQRDAVTEISSVPPARAVLTMASSTFGFVEHPERDLAVLAELARTVPVYDLRIGDLAEAVEAIERVVAGVVPAAAVGGRP